MTTSELENKIRELQQEHSKGMVLIEETKAKVFRIEGAIIQLQELLKNQTPAAN